MEVKMPDTKKRKGNSVAKVTVELTQEQKDIVDKGCKITHINRTNLIRSSALRWINKIIKEDI